MKDCMNKKLIAFLGLCVAFSYANNNHVPEIILMFKPNVNIWDKYYDVKRIAMISNEFETKIRTCQDEGKDVEACLHLVTKHGILIPSPYGGENYPNIRYRPSIECSRVLGGTIMYYILFKEAPNSVPKKSE